MWQTDSHPQAPTCDSDGNISVPSWKRASLTVPQKEATKSLSTILSHFTSLHNIYYYMEFFFFIFFLPLPSPSFSPSPQKCKLLEGHILSVSWP